MSDIENHKKIYQHYRKNIALSYIQLLQERNIPISIGYLILLDIKKAFEQEDPKLKLIEKKVIAN